MSHQARRVMAVAAWAQVKARVLGEAAWERALEGAPEPEPEPVAETARASIALQ